MSPRARLLAARREHLRERVQAQRAALGERTRAFAPLLTWADRGAQAWSMLRAHPWAATVPALALLVLGRRRSARTLSGALVAWRVVRSLRGMLRAYRSRAPE